MILKEEEYLQHYGTPRRSGRYPWGSGGQPIRSKDFTSAVEELRKKGLTDAKIAEGMGINSTQFRARLSIAKNERQQEGIDQITRLQEKGYSTSQIGRRLGINESTVRSRIALRDSGRVDVLQVTANMLKDEIAEKGYIDVGKGVSNQLGINESKLRTAVSMLQERENYKLHYMKVPQLGTGEFTQRKVLGKPNSPYPKHDQIGLIGKHSEDQGRSWLGIAPPLSLDSSRINIRYGDEGGKEADGVIYVRPGVKDLSLGKANYAQVRIAVDNTHYLKGMAMYRNDLPKGVDLEFNTNKPRSGDKHDVMKPLKDDPDNPFGAQIKTGGQITIKDAHGKDVCTSVMNKVYEEGDWENWSRSLSAQVLSKQDPHLAKTQLDWTYEKRRTELDEIERLTNPVIRKTLLSRYAEETDAAAVHLKAAALPDQASHVILPIRSMRDTEVYAPNYKPGERVALIRYPHGGKFEIPILKVNNRQPEAKKLLGTSTPDAIGIHPKVAQRLSGADFDGDTVLVIPIDRGRTKGIIKNAPPLEGLKDFDPQRAYPPYNGMRTIDGGTYHEASKSVVYPKDSQGRDRIKTATKQHEMGKVTNLIADMTIRGANNDELARAVRHSMVVIDSEKHSLNYKASERANGIPKLKAVYQGIPAGKRQPERAGASTLITLAKSQTRVPHRKLRPASQGGPIDPLTGKKVWVYTGATYTNKKGEVVKKMVKSKKLAEEEDAFKLSSGTRIEDIYATHSNLLKALANEARKEVAATKPIRMNNSAKRTYAKEVAELNSALNIAMKNAPLERQAQAMANVVVSFKKSANPDLSFEDLQKIKGQALAEQRIRFGVSKTRIRPTQEQWNAIQAGAISTHKLEDILANSDLDTIKKLATPKVQPKMTAIKKQRAIAMLDIGYTQAEIADALGVSVSTLKASINE